MNDFFKEAFDIFQEYEVESNKDHEVGYDTDNFKNFNQNLDGLSKGLYIFAGESNCGKTAVMTNLLQDFGVQTKNKLFSIYYTLDDTTNEVIPRIIAMNQKIPISVCAKPKRYEALLEVTAQNPQEMMYQEEIRKHLELRKQGIQLLQQRSNQFMITDGTRVNTFEDIVEHAKRAQEFVKSIDPENNIMIGIDSISDIKFKNRTFKQPQERHEALSESLKQLANTELQIPVFGTCHLRKLNHAGRPVLDDLKETGRYQYDASVVFLTHNDVSKNKNAAKIFYTNEENEFIQPVIELDWAKNKRSEFKGRSFYYFVPKYSYVQECVSSDIERFNNIIKG